MRWQGLPNFEDMPRVEGMPHGCAWGLFDVDGQRDQLGTLNLLEPEMVLKAREEIQVGESIALKWPLHCVHEPAVNRQAFQHSVKSLQPLGYAAYDDEVSFNTQSGSQWDSLRHWANQATGLHYNGQAHANIANPDCMDNSIHYWSVRGGIVGRGVLIDYHSWASRQGIEHPATQRTFITVADIEAVVRYQGVKLLPEDVLIIRTGWVEWFNGATPDERRARSQGDRHIIPGGTRESVSWLWDHHFAAMAADCLAFEAWPPQPPYGLHDYLLAMWGCPIGELWDLENLAHRCQVFGRWSFFLTSAPLNIAGGVASPPNALAIF